MKRREFLATTAVSLAGMACGTTAIKEPTMINAQYAGKVMTVCGPIDPAAMGVTLPHEHILVDFIGAEQVSPDRYDVEEVFTVTRPYLTEVAEHGLATLVECTPAYLGRDVALLKRLSQSTGVHLLTNTGYYGAANDQFVPTHAYEESAAKLAARWTAEWEKGIDGTEIRPGFIKTAVDNGSLSAIDAKLVRAAALTHRATGLPIASHTTDGRAIEEQVAILEAEGVAPDALIWVHAHTVNDEALHARLAEKGVWIEFDGLTADSLDAHLRFVTAMKEAGWLNKVLVSHDAGWYSVGEEQGGAFRGYTTFFTDFVPALRDAGFTEQDLRRVTRDNPARAFAIALR